MCVVFVRGAKTLERFLGSSVEEDYDPFVSSRQGARVPDTTVVTRVAVRGGCNLVITRQLHDAALLINIRKQDVEG